MADVMAALKEAFGAFKKNIAGCLIYTFVFLLACTVVLGIMLAILFVFSIITAGSIVGAMFTGTSSIVSLVLIGGALLVLLLGMLITFWFFSGLVGSYYDALHSLLVARKPSIGGFFTGIPKKATPIFLAELIQGLIIFVPTFALAIIAAIVSGGSGIASIAIQMISGLYSAIIAFLTVFIAAAVVVDGKGGISSLQHSMSLVSRNIVTMIIYTLSGFVLALPIAIAVGVPMALSIITQNSIVQVLLGLGVLFSLAYTALFFLPVMVLFNMSLYRKLK